MLMADSTRAVHLIEHHGLNIIVGGQVQTVLGWMGRLPPDLPRTRPRLGILHSCALLFTGDLEASESRLQGLVRTLV